MGRTGISKWRKLDINKSIDSAVDSFPVLGKIVNELDECSNRHHNCNGCYMVAACRNILDRRTENSTLMRYGDNNLDRFKHEFGLLQYVLDNYSK